MVFEDYFQPGTRVALDWLTGDSGAFRTTLYLTNPSAAPVSVTATITSADGKTNLTNTYSVPPHSLLTLPQLFRDDPVFKGFAGGGGLVEQAPGQDTLAATAAFSANGPF